MTGFEPLFDDLFGIWLLRRAGTDELLVHADGGAMQFQSRQDAENHLQSEDE